MPCLNLSTNVNLDGVDTSSILSEATKSVAKIIGKPEAIVESSSLRTANYGSKGGAPEFKITVLGTTGGIGQPLAMMMKINPLLKILNSCSVVSEKDSAGQFPR